MSLSLISLAYATIALGLVYGLMTTVFKGFVTPEELKKYLAFVFLLNVCFFLPPLPTVFAFLAVIFLIAARGSFDPLIGGVFFMLLLPGGDFPIGRMPGINYIIQLDWPLLVSAFFLMPLALRGLREKPERPFRSIDTFIWVIFFAVCITSFRATTFTDALRGVLYAFLGLVVPYFAASRWRDLSREKMVKLLRIFAFGLLIVGVIGLLASFIHWNFYGDKDARLFNTIYRVKGRGAILRMGSTFGFSYADYGIMMTVGMLLCIPFLDRLKSQLAKYGILGLFLVAAFFSGSRGPFVALLPALVVLAFSRPNPMKSLFSLGATIVAGLLVLSLTEAGRGIIAYLPVIGGAESGNIDYREQLLETGLEVAMRTPIFGNPHFEDAPELEALRQGEGIIDLVNTYLTQALRYGFPVAALYTFAHFWPPIAVVRALRKLNDEEDKHWRLVGGALAAALMLFAVGYAGTSKQHASEELGWILIGLNVVYLRILAHERRHPPRRHSDGERAASATSARKQRGQADHHDVLKERLGV